MARVAQPNTNAVGANTAAREAARAVFAQLKAPPAAAAVAVPQTSPLSPANPAQSANRPLPRGSIVNILV